MAADMASDVRLDAGIATLRRYRVEDTRQLQLIANDPGIAATMRDMFPHPYTTADAEEWIKLATGGLKESSFAIEVNGELAGGVGVQLYKKEARVTAEMGYWLGRRFWGQGIATAATGAFVPWVFETYPEISRLQACVFDSNPASGRVLEKNGFELEATLRRSITKNGQIHDQLIYVRFREE